MIILTHKGVEVFINKFKNANQHSYWDNYDLIIWKKNSNGYTSIKGSFQENSWGISDRVSVNSQGLWKISSKYVKYFK
jgi:hypothetical protein